MIYNTNFHHDGRKRNSNYSFYNRAAKAKNRKQAAIHMRITVN